MRGFLFAVFLACAPAHAAETLKVAVLYTNDVHGWIFARPASWNNVDPSRLIGGFPAAANAVKKEKLPKLLLDAGDWFQGTPENALTRGGATVEAFNRMGYDAVAVGNHDFDFGQARWEELSRAHKAKVLGSNIYREPRHERPDFITPWFIKELEGVKIGVFGLTTSRMRDVTFEESVAGLSFRREADEARDMVLQLRAQGATVIIAVTHIGFMEPGMRPFEDDKILAGEVPGIDLIVGGHTHTVLREPVRDPRNGTLIVQGGMYLSQLGRVELEIDRTTGKVVGAQAKLMDLWVDEWGEDPEMKALVARYQAEADRKLSVVIATATARLPRGKSGEGLLGDWVTDCVRAWAGTDVAVQNLRGMRSDLPAGPIRLRAIWEAMPFDNRIATMTLTGVQVRAMVEEGIASSIGTLQVSGLAGRYRGKAEAGHRVGMLLIAGQPIKGEGRYTVAAPDFMVQRSGGSSTLGQGEGTAVTGSMIRDVLIECATKAKVIHPPRAGRIIQED